MTTTSRKDFDAEMATWLESVKGDQAEANLYAELWLANVEAKAIKDPRSPAKAEAHAKIDRIIGRIEAL